jgi:hypothetical protein
MGSVFRVLDRELGYEVALKTFHGVSGHDRLALKREFRTLLNIVHPNLVTLHDLFVDESHCFFTMELVTGSHFVDYLLGLRQTLDSGAWKTRLCDTARQLALAVNALHEGGALHRDIKPSNALVTEAGRVVLLDFGLAIPRTLEPTAAREFAGTVAYAAPEQLWSEPVTRASDWYGFGASLYEAVTGRLPVEGRSHDIAYRKRKHLPTSLRDAGYDIEPELDSLIVGLLQPDPEQRPDVDTVLRCLGGELPQRVLSVPPASGPATVLVGREPELALLAGALDQARAETTVLLELRGVSGIGKSSLVRRFVSDLGTAAFVLTSRCHPQEALAFNAIDGLVDELARVLETSSGLDSALPTACASALSKLFPALAARLGRAGHDAELDSETRANQHSRRLAFSALRTLFERASRRRPLVLWIDDLQWADEDSGVLLRELLRPPSYGLLTILSYRSEDGTQSACLRALESSVQGPLEVERRQLTLGPLDPARSLDLVRSIAGPALEPCESLASELLAETEGSPFLLREVALFLRAVPAEPRPAGVSLDELLRLRTHALAPQAREVLEVFAVAGAPLDQNVALRAAGFTLQQRGTVADLERLSMLRTTDAPRRVSEIYHHRIREEILAQLPSSIKLQRHGQIAQALLSTATPNPLLAVDHFEAAGDMNGVRRYIVTAANHAYNSLAFERAARLYERAISLGVTEMLPHELRTRRALSLSNAGRAYEAGTAFQDARSALAALPHADLEQGLELGKSAAEHFIQSGHYAEGLAALRDVMGALAIPLPKTRGRALLKATLLRIRMTSVSIVQRTPTRSPPSARELLRFDTLWSTSIRVSMVDYTLSSYAVIRCALDALRLGEPSRLACALALEATNLATLPFPPFNRRSHLLFEAAKRLVEEHSFGYERAFLLGSLGVTACFRSDFDATVRYMDAAQALVRESRQQRHYEFALWETWAMLALAHQGELKELARRADALRKLGNEREDRFVLQMTNLGRPCLAWLAEDRAEYALNEADRALGWAPSDYNTQHYWHFTTTIECELYRGNFDTAWRHARAQWPAQERNHFLSVIFARDELWFARSRAALGKAASLLLDPNSGRAARREGEALLELARKGAGRLKRFDLLVGTSWATLLNATVSHLTGHHEAAVSLLCDAITRFDAAGMQLYREASRYCLGALLGRVEGERLLQQARAWMSSQGVKNPAAMVRMMAPGMPDAERPTS